MTTYGWLMLMCLALGWMNGLWLGWLLWRRPQLKYQGVEEKCTGSSKEEAEKFLSIAKWKVQNAIDERQRYWKERYQENKEDNERTNSRTC